MRNFFISYSSQDRESVNELADYIALMFDDAVWYDQELKQSGGQLWWDVILSKIRECDIFIYALSSDVTKSEPCRRELEYARSLKKPILPIQVADVDLRRLPLSLQSAQIIDFRQRNSKHLLSVKESIRNIPPAPPLPDPLPLPPEMPLDPLSRLFDRIARIDADQEKQTLLIADIEEFLEQEGSGEHSLSLIEELLQRNDVLTPRSRKRLQELQERSRLQNSDPVQAAVRRARHFKGKLNNDWQPFVTTFPDLPIPDMTFCLVPVGTFRMGSEDGNDNEQPSHVHEIVEPYWISQYPVTNSQWEQAVKARVVAEPETPPIVNSNWFENPEMRDYPVVGVSWFMARDFAAWFGGRLPTEVEWEFAARGIESWIYPWGNDWDNSRAVTKETGNKRPSAVTSHVEGRSWVDARHLCGNTWEWTRSVHERYPYSTDDGREDDIGRRTDKYLTIRGGSFSDVYYKATACSRSSSPPIFIIDIYGFRVVRPVR